MSRPTPPITEDDLIEAAVTCFLGASPDARAAACAYVNSLHLRDRAERLAPEDVWGVLTGRRDAEEALRARLEEP